MKEAVRRIVLIATLLFLAVLGASCGNKSHRGGAGLSPAAFVGTASIGAVSSEISITMKREAPRGEFYRDLEISVFSSIASVTSVGVLVQSEQRTDVFVFVRLDGSESMVIPARVGARHLRLVSVATPVEGGAPISMNEVSFDPSFITRMSIRLDKK